MGNDKFQSGFSLISVWYLDTRILGTALFINVQFYIKTYLEIFQSEVLSFLRNFIWCKVDDGIKNVLKYIRLRTFVSKKISNI